jgi:carbonic anhydrase
MQGNDTDHERPENLSADAALQRLQRGNRRFIADSLNHPRGDANRRDEVASGQNPYATIVTCADSRVPPELVFDNGLGDLFVIRVAGNIVDDAILGSIEYATLHLGVNLIVVLGHGSCGAVTAAVDNVDVDGPATCSHIDALIDAIRPAVQKAAAAGDDDLLERSIRENTLLVADKIRCSEPILAGMAKAGVKVHPAHYDMESGRVHWLS